MGSIRTKATHYYSEGPVSDEDKPLKSLLRDLSSDSAMLFRQESELFRREMDHRLTRVQRDVTTLGAGGVIAYVGVLALTTALILALALVMAAWAAALLVGAIYVTAGGLLLWTGQQKLKHEDLAPRESMRSVKTDVRTMREAMR
jgi:hypothetical protein